MVSTRYHDSPPLDNETGHTDYGIPVVVNTPPIFHTSLISRTLEHKAVRRFYPAERYKDGFLIGRDVKNIFLLDDYRPQPLAYQIKHSPAVFLSKAERQILWAGIKLWLRSKLPKRHVMQRMDTFVQRPAAQSKTFLDEVLPNFPHAERRRHGDEY